MNDMKPRCFFANFFLILGCLSIGWVASFAYYRGQYAMAAFMDGYSALAYLEKGDVPSATLLLRTVVEVNVVEADKYRDWELWMHNPNAASDWFANYAALRRRLPENSRGPVDEEFDKRLSRVLDEAVMEVELIR